MTSSSFLTTLLVSFVCSTIVAAAPVMNSTSHAPFDSTENSSSDVFNNHVSDHLQRSNSTITVMPELATANDSATFLDKPSIFNATGNGRETAADNITATEFNTYGPESNSTLTTVAPNIESKPIETGPDTIITNSTFNDSIVATCELKTNSTVFDDDLAIAKSRNSTLNSVDNINSTIVQPQSNLTALNSTTNSSVDTAQQSTSNSSINSMPFSAESQLEPEVSNSTATNTSTGSIVAEQGVGLQLGLEETNTSYTKSAIVKRSFFPVLFQNIWMYWH
ncbi:Hypothetical protein CINCED_3A014770 [Cinara cedri]|uniref:Uncharacterized protein n=1 Tax=Cinara cedri TaxID=506608 RepID=A0A5E4NGW0_9HEMI|nr:Hypothetical protein CINCED_3A014770 [Cinara cedri]